MALQRSQLVERVVRSTAPVVALIVASLRSGAARPPVKSQLCLVPLRPSVPSFCPISPSNPCLGRTNRRLNPFLFLPPAGPPFAGEQRSPTSEGCRAEYNLDMARSAGGLAGRASMAAVDGDPSVHPSHSCSAVRGVGGGGWGTSSRRPWQ